MILIYNDDGVSADSFMGLQDCFKNSISVSSVDLQCNTLFKNATLFIMPGGRSLPFYDKLGKKGNNNIKAFVAAGGCYVGICAGAYYAARNTIFAQRLSLELILPGELNFFEGAAIGPVFAKNNFAYNTEQGAQMVALAWESKKEFATLFPGCVARSSVYFNGGCYFENADQHSNTKILAVYAENNKPAIIECRYGKGRAILSGVHPELKCISE